MVTSMNVKLNTTDDVKEFINIVNKFDQDFNLASGRYVIDAKSIMGIFSLNLSKVINLNSNKEFDTNLFKKFDA